MEHVANSTADLGSFIGDQISFIVSSARKRGVSTRTIMEETSRALAPLVGSEAIEGFASAEEGLNELLTAEGGCVPLSAAAKLYKRPQGVTRQALTERIGAGRLIAYKSGSRDYILPVWQFRPEGGTLNGLDRVLKALREKIPGFGPIVPFTFFLQEHPATGGETPLAALRAGRIDDVLNAVSADAP